MGVRLLLFFDFTATTVIYTLSLHDALPISARIPSLLRPLHHGCRRIRRAVSRRWRDRLFRLPAGKRKRCRRSEEHTSELQSQSNLVCRLLLEKKKERLLSKREFTDPALTGI